MEYRYFTRGGNITLNITKYKIITFILLVTILVGGAVFVYPDIRIGAEDETKGRIAYVDLWAVFNVHPRKGIAEKKLNQLAQSMQSELEEKAKDLPKEKQQSILQEYQSELSQREQELIQKIVDSIKDVIIEVAEQKEVKMVLDKKNVIYGGYDMTQDVIDYVKNKQETEKTGSDDKTAEDGENTPDSK